MAVTEDDVRHVAELARLGVAPGRLADLASELSGILAHMEVLSQVDTSSVESNFPTPVDSTPLRSDSSGPIPMCAAPETFAPAMRDGLFLVPRLTTHENASDSAG